MFFGKKSTTPEKLLSPIRSKKDGSIEVTGGQLARATRANIDSYISGFRPNSKILSEVLPGAGWAVDLQNDMGGHIGRAIDNFRRSYLSVSIQNAGFCAEVSENRHKEVCDLADWVSRNPEVDLKFNSAAASILFDYGAGKAGFMKFDALGEPKFKNDLEKLSCVMIYQFFAERCPPVHKVRGLLS
jgi:hypothetical protein